MDDRVLTLQNRAKHSGKVARLRVGIVVCTLFLAMAASTACQQPGIPIAIDTPTPIISSPEPDSAEVPDTSEAQAMLPTPTPTTTSTPLLGTMPEGDSVPTESSEQPDFIQHTVQPGETLYDIAIAYGIDAQLIITANNLSDPDMIFAGQVLNIPVGGELPPSNPADETAETPEPSEPVQPPPAGPLPPAQIIGTSTGGHPIEAYRFGEGPIRVALIGGIHGGYEWNTILLAYEMMDHFVLHPEEIPPELTVYVVPSANPDGQFLITGMEGRFSPEDVQASGWFAGRFNGNGVDLNRNWECNWEATAYMGDIEVSAGDGPFSEVESRALRDFFLQESIEAVVFWHSSAGGVFPGGCEEPFPPAQALGRAYAEASGYYYQDLFTAYAVTGDATDWLSSIGVPGIVVEFATQTDPEFAENLAGVRAIFLHLTEDAE